MEKRRAFKEKFGHPNQFKPGLDRFLSGKFQGDLLKLSHIGQLRLFGMRRCPTQALGHLAGGKERRLAVDKKTYADADFKRVHMAASPHRPNLPTMQLVGLSVKLERAWHFDDFTPHYLRIDALHLKLPISIRVLKKQEDSTEGNDCTGTLLFLCQVRTDKSAKPQAFLVSFCDSIRPDFPAGNVERRLA